MNNINKLLLYSCVFFMGLLCGKLSNNTTKISYKNQYISATNITHTIQENFLNFYIQDYCEEKNIQTVKVKTFATTFDGVYCNKSTILLLEDKLPLTAIDTGENL